MKTLMLIRHAKSSWDDPKLSDFERPLNKRGERDAPKMGKRMKEREITPDIIISSPAERAIKTCEIITGIMGCPKSMIKRDERVYHAGEDELYAIVKELPDRHDVVMLFGHNPGFTDFANSLTDDYIDNIPTAGIVSIRLHTDKWNETEPGCGKIQFFDFPKKNLSK